MSYPIWAEGLGKYGKVEKKKMNQKLELIFDEISSLKHFLHTITYVINTIGIIIYGSIFIYCQQIS